MHIRNEEYPYEGWARDFPNVSFPFPRDGLDFPEHDIWWVHDTPQPEHDPDTEMVEEGEPEQVGGQWQQTWRVVPRPPVPVIYPQFTALEMLDLFSEDEQLAVVGATMVEPAVKLWYDRMLGADFITYEDPRTEGGLQALVDAGLLTPERKAEISAAMQPT
jgi:hypothetical protein